MKLQGYIKLQWIMAQAFLALFCFVSLVILGSNFSTAMAEGDPLPWFDIVIVAGMQLFAFGLVWVSRRFFNLIAGSEICKWGAS